MSEYLLMDDYKLIAQSDYTAYTMERLDNRYELLSSIITDRNASDDEITKASTERKKVLKCIELFLQEDVDDPRATPALILNIKFGDGAVNRLSKRTVGGEIAHDLVSKTGDAFKGTGQVTKKGINKVAQWLLDKTK
jgi:hypothetical protein